MKLDIISDLHLDFYQNKMPRLTPEADVLVVAGDLAEWRRPQWLDGLRMLTSQWRDVIYVAGNHEYYGSSVNDLAKYREKAKEFKNLHWLENESVELDGQRFCGATGWFPDRPDNFLYQRGMGDFTVIRGINPWATDSNATTRRWLDHQVMPSDVVITHHLPGDQCVSPKWRGNSLNRFFVAGFDGIKPKAWIFGHTHDPMDFTVDEVRYLCNPAGYPGERGIRPTIKTVDL